ncbi:MAG TPA: ABC transporter permease subunit, partial [Nitrososphaerales archaeon]|nr:ABC transporter permease subunit [Nitrososphaerales archaeon]
MRLSKSWIIAAKDFKTYRKKKNIIYALFVVPFLVAILITAVIGYVGTKGTSRTSPAELVVLLPAFLFVYVILGAYLATPISSYTIVGEKVEKSLEPLLATPTTDSEILLGKGIAAFLPPLAAIWGGSVLFMVLMDLTTEGELGYYYFPGSNTALVLLLLIPLALLMSVLVNIIVSSRVTDVRTGQQLGALTIIPFAGLYLSGELNLIDLGDTSNLLI